MRVLITGAAGAIGKPVCEFLAQRGHEVRRFDRSPSGDGAVIADIADTKAVFDACASVDAILHLAATPDDAPFLELIPPNVIGVFNVLDAARRHGVGRVVLASSVQVSWSPGPDQKRSAAHATPRNHYALTKLWSEHMAEMYSRVYKMSIVAARIGWMVRTMTEALAMRTRSMMRNYVSRRDISHFMACAIETPNLEFDVFYAIGPGGAHCYDLDSPRRAIGYEPQDHFPSGLPFALPEEDG
ncbi:MAG TPA: NAD(P)-dependent oxidoreductase [Polyangiaceae bacterium]|jgi:nucleoside-diphosphate-sugar epimerase